MKLQTVNEGHICRRVITDMVSSEWNSHYVGTFLAYVSRFVPQFYEAIQSVERIHIITRNEMYQALMNEIATKEGWGDIFTESMLEFFPFEKPNNYSMRGLCFKKHGLIIINLHQIEQCADEYLQYIQSDERMQKRNHAYYVQDSQYENFEQYVQSKEEAVSFLFWNTLFDNVLTLTSTLDEEADRRDLVHSLYLRFIANEAGAIQAV